MYAQTIPAGVDVQLANAYLNETVATWH